MKSINITYDDSLDSYFGNSNNSSAIKSKDVEQIEQGLIDEINRAIDLNNAFESGSSRKKHIQSLPSYVIALLVSRLYVFKNISLLEDSDSTGGSILAMYQQEGPNEGLYVSDDKTINNCIRKFNRSMRCIEIKEVKASLADMAPTVSLTMEMDLIPVNNGIFDYKNKALMPFSSDYVFVTKSNVNYIVGAVNPVIKNPDDTYWDVESWISGLSDDKEIVALLWQIIGAVLRPNVSWDKAILFYNENGNNGKGTLCELIRNICGRSRCTSLSISDFSHQFKLVKLLRAMAVVTDENDTRSFTENISQFKAIVTGDSVTIDRKYETPVDIQFRGLIIECINDLPKMGDKTNSLYRRLLIIPFDKCFTGSERKYIKHDYLKRKEVLQYVMCKVLNMNYYTFDEPEACKNLLGEFKAYNDNIRQFLDDVLPRLTWKLAPWDFLYELYKKWLEKHNPRGKLEGDKTFRKDVRAIIQDYPGWKVTTNPMHSTIIRGIAEPLIVEFDVWSWKNSHYHGLNIVQEATPSKLKETYRGLCKV